MSSTNVTVIRELIGILLDIPGMERPDVRFDLLSLGFSQVEKSMLQDRRSNDVIVDLNTIVQYADTLGKLDVLIDNAKGRSQSRETRNKLDAFLNNLKYKKPEIIQNSNTTTHVLKSAEVSDRRYDVFLAHNSQDKPQVKVIAEALKRRGIRPWLDDEQIRPGQLIQDVIQEVMPAVKSAAIFIGSSGLGKWQVAEIRALVRLFLEANLPVIPVLLPGVDRTPDNLLFLKEPRWVRFKKSVDEVDALDELVWGITGQRPKRS